MIATESSARHQRHANASCEMQLSQQTVTDNGLLNQQYSI